MRYTERRSAATIGLDRLPTSGVVDALIDAHADVPSIVAAATPATTNAVNGALARVRAGGRLVYAGSGTSGWLADADAAEIPATFGFPADRLVVVRTLVAREQSLTAPDEDAPDRGREAIGLLRLGCDDVVVAIAASGSTPFTVGAAERGAADGAFVVAVTNVVDSPLREIAAVTVRLPTAAEPIMGSTRMRAGLAQRMWLTVFSTALMVRLGLTYDNLMVGVRPVLAKLRERQVTILREATGLDASASAALLESSGGELGTAMVMALANADAAAAHAALERVGGRTREAIASLRLG